MDHASTQLWQDWKIRTLIPVLSYQELIQEGMKMLMSWPIISELTCLEQISHKHQCWAVFRLNSSQMVSLASGQRGNPNTPWCWPPTEMRLWILSLSPHRCTNAPLQKIIILCVLGWLWGTWFSSRLVGGIYIIYGGHYERTIILLWAWRAWTMYHHIITYIMLCIHKQVSRLSDLCKAWINSPK